MMMMRRRTSPRGMIAGDEDDEDERIKPHRVGARLDWVK